MFLSGDYSEFMYILVPLENRLGFVFPNDVQRSRDLFVPIAGIIY